ncbi:hypothetical protein HPB50_014412 [Hyalomma asiaticum]|uniref:Uncharacterized protein n=1 Tax=Hyalomma asiaticum TaxID=266040 RepID=A0ACB7S6F0_HYAAI|nr:hypothetical protein HPB50_014412 [Hyalomma asiaticum]
MILKINDRITLNLKRSEVFTDDFVFISDENGEQVRLPMRKEDYEKNLYHDEELLSSLVVRDNDGLMVNRQTLPKRVTVRLILAEQYLVHPGQDQNQILDVETLKAFNKYYENNTDFTSTDLTYLVTGLGCVHDGSPAVSALPGHKGSSNCSWDDGYLMSYMKKDSNQYKFSPCCIADILNLLGMEPLRDIIEAEAFYKLGVKRTNYS